MKTERMKLDYNNLMSFINEVLESDDIKNVQNNAGAIGMGLNLLGAYMVNIAKRALELNDEVLIGLLLDLCLLEEEEKKEEVQP